MRENNNWAVWKKWAAKKFGKKINKWAVASKSGLPGIIINKRRHAIPDIKHSIKTLSKVLQTDIYYCTTINKPWFTKKHARTHTPKHERTHTNTHAHAQTHTRTHARTRMNAYIALHLSTKHRQARPGKFTFVRTITYRQQRITI